MANKIIKSLFNCCIAVLVLTGCSRDYTTYYADTETPGVAIFSDKGNNIFTCFIDGRSWRTMDRVQRPFSPGISYEVTIRKFVTANTQDSLVISWEGFFSNNVKDPGAFSLSILVSKNFAYTDLTALEGKRVPIDGSHAFFTTNISGINPTGTLGKGNIFFKQLVLRQVSNNLYTGQMSGLLEADFNTFKVASGRFDHTLDERQVIL